MADQADRFNSGKPKYSYIDLTCLEPCARVMEYGATKYSKDNWKKGSNESQIIDSLLRHIAALQRGEVFDPESGLSHVGHIQANAMFLGNIHNTLDIPVSTNLSEICGDVSGVADSEEGAVNE